MTPFERQSRLSKHEGYSTAEGCCTLCARAAVARDGIMGSPIVKNRPKALETLLDSYSRQGLHNILSPSQERVLMAVSRQRDTTGHPADWSSHTAGPCQARVELRAGIRRSPMTISRPLGLTVPGTLTLGLFFPRLLWMWSSLCWSDIP